MIKILLVDDQKVIREQLKSYFEPEADLQIVDTAVNSIEALDKIKLLQPQIVLMDVEMPGGLSGLELTSIISDLFPKVKVIILTGHYTEEYGEKAVRVGAGAYLAKSTSAEGLISAIKQLCPSSHLIASGNSSLLSREPLTKIVNYHDSRCDQSLTVNAEQDRLLAAAQSVGLQHQPAQSSPLFQFFRRGIILNSLVWIAAFLYLKFTPPTYSSQWGIKILSQDSAIAVAMTDGEQGIPPTRGGTASINRDPRHDYLYVANSPKLLTESATLAQMTVADYHKPKITVDEQNGIIAFQIKGNSPELAINKAQAFHQAMTQQIESLRQQELARQQAVNKTVLTQAKANLVSAQNKLSQYWAEAGINTDAQINSLTDNLESLRRQQVELFAHQKIVANRYSQLDQEPNNLSVLGTDEGGKLIEDIVDPQAQSAPVPNSLVSFDVLIQSSSPSDLDQNSTEWELSTEQNQELSAQIEILEARLLRMTHERMQEASLKQALQVAQTAVTNASAKLNQEQEYVAAIYPHIQLVTAPNLPHKPSNPNPGFVFRSGLLTSLLVTAGWTLLWSRQRKDSFVSSNSQ